MSEVNVLGGLVFSAIFIYMFAAIVTFFVGLLGMVIFSDDGRGDEDFQRSVFAFKHFYCPPYVCYKIIKNNLEDAEKEAENNESNN